MAKVALCIIATNNYMDFVPKLIDDLEKYFLLNHDVNYHIFSNTATLVLNYPVKRQWTGHYIKHEPWPAMTLKRYEFIASAELSGYDYVYYIDADMRIVAPICEEIFGTFTAVKHPGYYRGGGAWENRQNCAAYVKDCKRKVYVAGGFQGGSKYYEYCKYIAPIISDEAARGIVARWHDESHWNRHFAYNREAFTLLEPSYCMPEDDYRRKTWRIDHFKPKIIALNKDHKKLRQ